MSELINFYPPWNDQEIIGLLMISEGIELNHLNSDYIRSKIWPQSLRADIISGAGGNTRKNVKYVQS